MHTIVKFLHFIAIITAELRVIECRELSAELSMRANAYLVPGIWSNFAVGASVQQTIATFVPTWSHLLVVYIPWNIQSRSPALTKTYRIGKKEWS